VRHTGVVPRLVMAVVSVGMALCAAATTACGGKSPDRASPSTSAGDRSSPSRPPADPAPTSGDGAASPAEDLGDYPTPVPVDTVALAANIPRAETRQIAGTATTKAVEIRVEGSQEVPTLNGRPAPAGRTFLVLDTSFKNVIPLQPAKAKSAGRSYGAGGLGFGVAKEGQPASDTPSMEPTPYVVGEVPKHIWLLTDNRYADPIDVAATMQVPDHLPPNRFMIARLGDVLRGKLVFDAPMNARYMALLFLDTTYGHALIPVKGSQADAPAPKTVSSPAQNELLELAVTEAAWAANAPPAPEGFRYFVVGVRGSSRSPGNIVQLELDKYVFLEDEQALVAQPVQNANWLPRPFKGLAPFLPGAPNEGQLAFLLPADTQKTMLLLRPPAGGGLDLPAPDRVSPSWPRPAGTIADGSTLKLHYLPAGPLPQGLRPPPPGREYRVLDVVAENLLAKGVEVQPNQQFRLQDANGAFYAPAPDTNRLRFHPTGRGVVPPSGARRLQMLYLVPAGQALRLAYRGFETTQTIDLP
jgi:hypothetical protein